MQIDNIPWTEKYRPNCFGNIIFNKYSDQFFNNLIQNNYFPNLLLYGPPGTGKTTSKCPEGSKKVNGKCQKITANVMNPS